jgi:hypothetical protein
MTRARAAVVIAVVAACGSPRGGTLVVPDDGPVVTWANPEPPYRLPAHTGALWVDDRRAVVACDAGWTAEVDLATGAVTTRRSDLLGSIATIARLADGRLIGIATKDERLRIYQVGADLAVTLLREDPDPGWVSPTIAVAADGRVALAGGGHPLDLYETDATTPVRTLSIAGATDHHWSKVLFADGDRRLLAQRGNELYVFDLATGIPTLVGYGAWAAAARGTLALAEIDAKLVVIDIATAATTSELAENFTAGGAVLSPDATLAARVDGNAVLVQDTTSKAVVARFDLGAAFAGGPYGWDLAFTPSGRQLVVAGGSIVRVVDLVAGTITAAGDGPYATPAFIAVSREHVIAGGDRVRRWPVRGGAAETIGPDEPDVRDGAVTPSGSLIATARRVARTAADRPESELTVWRNSPVGIQVTRKLRKDSIASVAIDDAGQLMVGGWRRADGDAPGRNVIDVGRTAAGWKRLVEVHYDSYIDMIDPVTRLAAVSRAGAVRLIQLPGVAPVSTAAIPGCSSSGNVHIDGTGRRIATDDDRELWIWDAGAAKGVRIAAAAFSDPVGEVVFVPGTTEVVFANGHRVGLWDYTTRRAVGTPITGVVGRIALDAAGTRVAVGQKNGRILVIGLGELRKGTPITLAPGADVPACVEDPLAPPAERNP